MTAICLTWNYQDFLLQLVGIAIDKLEAIQAWSWSVFESYGQAPVAASWSLGYADINVGDKITQCHF